MGDQVLVPAISYDIDVLRLTYIPADSEELPIEEFERRGKELLELAYNCGIVLGELVDKAWQRQCLAVAQGKLERWTKTQHVRLCCESWGCEQTAVWRTWKLANPKLDFPDDWNSTLRYEVAAGCKTDEDFADAITAVSEQSLGVADVRDLKLARSHGWNTWEMIRFGLLPDGTIIAQAGDLVEPIGMITLNGNDSPLAKAGIALLQRRAGITMKERLDV